MMPAQIHEDIVATFRESAVSYDIVESWWGDFKCGKTSCVNQHECGPPITVTTEKNIKKVHNIVPQTDESS